MWDEKVIRRIDEVAEETIVPLRDDPRVIGYYSDNEIGWWNAILWKMTLEQPATSGQRQRLIRWCAKRTTTIGTRSSRTSSRRTPPSWEELDRGGMLWLRPAATASARCAVFLASSPTATTS